jgi:putative IMPACT (imprinted ancient) family translation regulator
MKNISLPFQDNYYLQTNESFKLYTHIIEDRGSMYSVSFGRVKNRNDIGLFLKRIHQQENHKFADHHSYAVRILHKNTIYETFSDDGETGAGKLILRTMEKHHVVNTIICVTRWFGGIKLEKDRFSHIKECSEFAIDRISTQKD